MTSMKRRTFTFGLGAALAAPAMPAAALSRAIPAAATQHFAVAKLIARAHNRCSVDMLMRNLRVDATTARDIHALLLQKGVITPPVSGVSMATNPLNTNCIPNEAIKPTNIRQSAAEVRARVTQLKEKWAKLADERQRAETAEPPPSQEDAPEDDPAAETAPHAITDTPS